MRMFLAFLMIAQNAQADILIQGPGTPALEYRAALKADPDLSSPSEQLLKSRPQTAKREALLTAFAEAQKSFLEKSKETAIERFTQVTAMILEDDWAKSDRQIFLHSFLRLAQMQIEIEKQKHWLTRALTAGDDIEVDNGLFPPPLVRGLKQLRAEIPRVAPPDSLFNEGWSAVLLNGSLCTRHSCPGWPAIADKVRVTFFSDAWQPATRIIDSSELKSARPSKLAWATGDCAKTQFSPASAALKQAQVFWGLACQSPVPSARAVPVNFMPAAPADAIPRLDIDAKKPKFYKSVWFWAGVGIVAACAIAAANKQKEKKETEPTTTYGYQ